jgi:hypothetical protein
MDFTSEASMFKLVTQRAEILRDAMPLIYERAVSAQQRQAIRFQRVQRRDVPSRLHRFKVDDYVYVSQRHINTLDFTTNSTILRERGVKTHGVLEMEAGAYGGVVRVRMKLCAPCHIPHLVTDAVGVPADLACEVCGSLSMADPMLLCHRCDRGYHIHCLTPPLEHVPIG